MGKSVYYMDGYYNKTDYKVASEKYFAISVNPDVYTSCVEGIQPGTGLYADPSDLCCKANTSFDGAAIRKSKSCDTVNYVDAMAFMPFALQCDGKSGDVGFCTTSVAPSSGCNMSYVEASTKAT